MNKKYPFNRRKAIYHTIFWLLVLIYQSAFSQNQLWLFDNPVINIKAALNFHYFVIPKDSNGGKNVLCPSFSIGLIKPLNQKFTAQFNLDYNSVGYKYSTGYSTYKTNNIGVDAALDYYPVTFLGIEAGVEPICILSSKIIEGATSQTVTKLPIGANGLNVLFYGGLTFNLGKGFSIYFNYNYSLPGQNININDYYQVGLNIKIPYNKITTKIEEPKIRREQAYSQIKELKDNALLIKLPNYYTQFLNKKDSVKNKLVYKAIENQAKTNDSIYHNFKKYFKFCPVYFYYSTDNKYIKSGQLKGYLLNDKLLPDSSIKFPYNKYYLGAFEEIESDTTDYNETTLYLQRYEFKSQSPKNAPSAPGSGLNVKGFVIKDSNQLPLKPPFPYYYKLNVLFNTYLIRQLVLIINQDLYYFYNQSMRDNK